MKNSVTDTREFEDLNFAFENAVERGELALPTDQTVATERETVSEKSLLDWFVAVLRFVFLFIPGAATIHFVMMGFAILYFYQDLNLEIIGSSIGILLVAAFMVVFGIARLRDLRYLRVVAGLIASGALAAILYSLVFIFMPNDSFGPFTIWSLPFTLLVGYMIKRDTDKKSK